MAVSFDQEGLKVDPEHVLKPRENEKILETVISSARAPFVSMTSTMEAR
jgi:hypothetical protein